MNALPLPAPSLGMLYVLARRLRDYGVEDDVRRIATVILETAREQNWSQNRQGMTEWLAELAPELVQSSRKGLQCPGPRIGIDQGFLD